MRLGIRLPGDSVLDSPVTRILGTAPEIRPHLGTPWLSDHLQEWHRIEINQPSFLGQRELHANASELKTHALIVGRSGSGKSRYALHILYEQMLAGCSCVVMDDKEDTVRAAAEAALAAGIAPEDITLLLPTDESLRIPRWNVLSGASPAAKAGALATSMQKLYGQSWGVRIQDLLKTSCTVAGAQGLSLFEAMEVLMDGNYMKSVLARSKENGGYERYPIRHAALEREFGPLSSSERLSQANPVTNKVREMLGNDYLSALLVSDADDLQIGSLWHRQRFIGIHLDQDALGGETSAAVLAALVTNSLDLESRAVNEKDPTAVPVALFLDELDVYERYVGDGLKNFLKRGRSRLMRFICATQNMEDLSGRLAGNLLSTAWLGAFFTLDALDAARVAAALPYVRGRIASCFLDADYGRGGVLETVSRSYPVLLPDGRPARLSDKVWQETFLTGYHGAGVLAALQKQGMGDAEIGGIKMEDCVRALSSDLRLWGPELQATITFPRPKITNELRITDAEAQREMAGLLMEMHHRHCLLRTQPSDTSRRAATYLVQTYRTEPKGIPAETMKKLTPKGRTMRQALDDLAARRAAVSRLSSSGTPSPVGSKTSRQQSPSPLRPEQIPSTFDRKKDDGAL